MQSTTTVRPYKPLNFFSKKREKTPPNGQSKINHHRNRQSRLENLHQNSLANLDDSLHAHRHQTLCHTAFHTRLGIETSPFLTSKIFKKRERPPFFFK